MSFLRRLFRRDGDSSGDPPERAKQLFNDGVAASLKAIELLAVGDVEKAKEQSQYAIDQFRAALKTAPNNSCIRGTLGHQLYVAASTFGTDSFTEAAELLETASQTEPDNVAFLCDLGLCRANLGDLPEAQVIFQRVVKLNNSSETKEHIATELGHMGLRAFNYGMTFQNQGQDQEAISYKKFAIGASMLAYRMQESRSDLARQVSTFAKDIGDTATADQYAALAKG